MPKKISKATYNAALNAIGTAYVKEEGIDLTPDQVRALAEILIKVGALMHQETSYEKGRAIIKTRTESNSVKEQWPQSRDINVPQALVKDGRDFAEKLALKYPHARKIRVREYDTPGTLEGTAIFTGEVKRNHLYENGEVV